ncbi:MAG: FtsX-like permease family protein, partial [Lachnospiraceae bacterium]|nr:FtsX-like permease family protein [Lachnospiraceae bacterium]
MKKSYWKMVLRTVKGSLSRFIAILAITALGVGFLTGLLCTAPDMKNSVDRYYDENRFMDVDIKSSMGLTEEDLEAVAAADGVLAATGVYQTDALAELASGESGAGRFLAIDFSAGEAGTVNSLTLTEGRYPEKAGECVQIVVDPFSEYASVGDVVTVTPEEDDEDLFVETELTVVGLVTSPLYMSTDTVSSSVGNGSVTAFFYVDRQEFDTEIYTDFFVTLTDAAALSTFTDEYDDLVDDGVTTLENLGETQEAVRYESLTGEAWEEIADAEEEYEAEKADAEAELADARQELSDALQEIVDGETALAEADTELADAAAELAEAEKELADAWQQLADAKKELDDGRAELDASWKTLNAGKAELDEASEQIKELRTTIEENEDAIEEARTAVAEYDAGVTAYEEGLEALAEARETLDTGWEEYEEGVTALEEARATLDASWEEYETQAAALETAHTQLEQLAETAEQLQTLADAGGTLTEEQQALLTSYTEGTASYEAGVTALAEAYATLTAGEESYETSKDELETALEELTAGEESYEANKKTLEETGKTLEDSEEQIEEARASVAEWDENYPAMKEAIETYDASVAEYEEGLAALEEAEKEYAEGLAEYEEGLASYEEGKAEYEDGLAEYEEGLAEVEENRQTLADGRAEYEEGLADYEEAKAEAEAEFADAEQEIADAKKDVEEIEYPEWYVLTRLTNASYYSFTSNADKVSDIAKVFPVFFFLVAALVALTTMTRMVEEERTEIGVMKALGYGRRAIFLKYLLYAGVGSVLGAVIGVLVGQWLFPTIIWNAYGIMYYYTGFKTAFLAQYALPSAFAAILSVLFAVWAAVHGTLADCPARLMLPKAPKEGKRIFLEHIPFLWNRMKFTYKVTARNLFRYKQRFFMTIVGIAGCTALLVAGFGIRDSIGGIVDIQYNELQQYALTLELDDEATDEDRETLAEALTERQEDYLEIYCELLDVSCGNASETIYAEVPQDAARFSEFINFRDRKTHEAVVFDENAVLLTEKLANTLGVGVGDTFTLENGDGVQAELTVTGITENYLRGYVYVGMEAWEAAYGESPDCQTWLVKSNASGEEEEEAETEELLKFSFLSSAQFASTLITTYDNMLGKIDYIVIVLILCAGLLAFVVLYNLIYINISERHKEIATIKVLGFHRGEVNAYIFRETFLLSIFGILAGLVAGFALHRFVILTVEVSYMMFGRKIHPVSYLYSACITMVFTVLVSLVMSRQLRRISMVESLT